MSEKVRVEGSAGSVAGARWAAIKELEQKFPGVDPDDVEFETVEEGPDGVRVVATAKADRDEREAIEAEQVEAEQVDAEEHDVAETEDKAEPDAEAAHDEEWPDDPGQRVAAILEEIVDMLEIEATVDLDEREDELVAVISGSEVGLLIGKHGQTIDAIQLVCGQAAYRGKERRKRVVVDADGYRERREEALHRQADRAAGEAVRSGLPVEMEPMTAQERRVVHTHLKDEADVDTHSEGDDPDRRVVVSPAGQ